MSAEAGKRLTIAEQLLKKAADHRDQAVTYWRAINTMTGRRRRDARLEGVMRAQTQLLFAIEEHLRCLRIALDERHEPELKKDLSMQRNRSEV